MWRALAESPRADNQEDGGRQDGYEGVHQSDRCAEHAEYAPEQEPKRDAEQQSSDDSMVWWRRIQGGSRCSESAVCQMRSRLSADLGVTVHPSVS